MTYAADPMAHKGTVDTTKYGAPVSDATFGEAGAQADSGMPTGVERTVTGLPASASDACAAVAVAPSTVASDRSAYLAFVDARTPRSLAN